MDDSKLHAKNDDNFSRLNTDDSGIQFSLDKWANVISRKGLLVRNYKIRTQQNLSWFKN